MAIKHIKQDRKEVIIHNGTKMWNSCVKCMFNKLTADGCDTRAVELALEGLDDCNEIENGYYVEVSK
jgi:hypothetical protein